MSCINNVEDQVPDEITEPVSYSAQVQTIFNVSCGGSTCHTNGGNQNGVNLSSYQATMASVGANYNRLIVEPDDAANSPLVDKIEANPEFGSRMPLGGSLSATEIALIKAWINQGAEDN